MSFRDVTASELFDEVRKANLRAVEAEQRLATIKALIDYAADHHGLADEDAYVQVAQVRKALAGEIT